MSEASSTTDHVWVTILAGGIGSRFWPASTPSRPKQLLPLVSERPLIEDTLERARSLAPDDRIRILAGSELTARFRGALGDLPDQSYLIEPRVRGTAPVLAWAAHEIYAEDPDAVLVSLHADHRAEPAERFSHLIGQAVEVAREADLLVTVGAVPDRPETGFGYIQPGALLDDPGGSDALAVGAFHEKPDEDTAERYLREGYLWNTGIFVWKAATLLAELRAHTPEIADHLPLLEGDDPADFFEACPTVTIDVAILERSSRVATLPCTFAWDDVGTWDALMRTKAVDRRGNVVLGPGLAVDAAHNVIVSEGAPVVLFDVDELVVVRTAGMTLVTRRERAADLKDLVSRLPQDYRDPEI